MICDLDQLDWLGDGLDHNAVMLLGEVGQWPDDVLEYVAAERFDGRPQRTARAELARREALS